MEEQKLQSTSGPANRWFHRRLMTYIALGGLFGLALGAFTQDLSAAQGSLLESIGYILGSVVFAYVGVKTVAERLGKA